MCQHTSTISFQDVVYLMVFYNI
uniref:Uncharacterized protein n=1 Tax=Arundo donax TaxID=35708 RepID=A0A0A9B6W5_ARUDO